MMIEAMVTSGFAAFLVMASSPATAAPNWQSSQHHQIELSIRDMNPSGLYEVTFFVVEPGGETTSVRRQVSGDVWGAVTYPNDFATVLRPGAYSWYGCVNGVKAVGGRFTFAVKTGSSSLTSSTKWPKNNSRC
jgi:hypothetical protein